MDFLRRAEWSPAGMPMRRPRVSYPIRAGRVVSLAAPLMTLAACLGAPEPYPTRPTAQAGPDTFGDVGQPVLLDGSGSSSPRDNAELVFTWSFENLPNGSLLTTSSFEPNDSNTAIQTQFVPDRPGRYVIRLDVSDDTASSVGDFVVVDVGGALEGPVADAGEDQQVTEGMAVYLDGSGSTDPNGEALYYRWDLEGAPPLSTLTSDDITNRYTPYPSLIADAAGLFTLSLIVSNGDVMSSPDYVFVQVASTNSPPVANAGEDQTVAVGDEALLDGSSSYDADNDPLTYTWTLLIVPVESSVHPGALETTSAGTARLTPDVPGRYVVELVVSDGQAKGQPDVVSLTAVPAS